VRSPKKAVVRRRQHDTPCAPILPRQQAVSDAARKSRDLTNAGARFIVDLVAAKDAGEGVSASLVVAQTFPMEEFHPRIKEGEDANALLDSNSLLRQHQFIPGQSNEDLCSRITADIGEKVLSKEYTERDD